MSDFAREAAGLTDPNDPDHLRTLRRLGPQEVTGAMARLEIASAVQIEPVGLAEEARLILPPAVLPPPMQRQRKLYTNTGKEYLTS